jgi:hypothetical protein
LKYGSSDCYVHAVKKLPYTALARVALTSDDDVVMEDAVDAFCSNEALCKK